MDEVGLITFVFRLFDEDDAGNAQNCDFSLKTSSSSHLHVCDEGNSPPQNDITILSLPLSLSLSLSSIRGAITVRIA